MLARPNRGLGEAAFDGKRTEALVTAHFSDLVIAFFMLAVGRDSAVPVLKPATDRWWESRSALDRSRNASGKNL